jgi:hypothetical protein
LARNRSAEGPEKKTRLVSKTFSQPDVKEAGSQHTLVSIAFSENSLPDNLGGFSGSMISVDAAEKLFGDRSLQQFVSEVKTEVQHA